jgi:hypothetical protein
MMNDDEKKGAESRDNAGRRRWTTNCNVVDATFPYLRNSVDSSLWETVHFNLADSRGWVTIVPPTSMGCFREPDLGHSGLHNLTGSRNCRVFWPMHSESPQPLHSEIVFNLPLNEEKNDDVLEEVNW